MKHLPSETNFDSRLIVLILLPSWLSSSIAMVAGIGVGVGTLLVSHYQTSSLRLELLNYDFTHTATYQAFVTTTSSGFLGDLPLLLFWVLIGLVLYLFAINIIRAIRNQLELNQELSYVHVNRRKLIWTAVEHFMIRLIIVLIWVSYTLFFFRTIVPYCGTAALAGSGEASIWLSAGFVLTSILVMVVAVHIHTILLRLFLFKPRVLSSVLYVD